MTRIDLSLVPWHEGEGRRALAMPLGGIGTGTVALSGDGSLRQWQLSGPGNHTAFVPDSFFAIRCSLPGAPDVLRALEAQPIDGPRVPDASDADVPHGLHRRHEVLPPLRGSRMRAGYPAAEVEFDDPSLPVEVTMRAFTPFVPLDEERSSLPASMFEIEVRNPLPVAVAGWLAASQQNTTGWDGVAPIDGTAAAGYGGAVNRERRHRHRTSLVLTNAAVPSDDPGYGQLVLTAEGDAVHVLEQYAALPELVAFLRGRYVLESSAEPWPETAGRGSYGGVRSAIGSSPPGRTWNGALAVPFRLAPGDRSRIRFSLTWWFPNRYVDFVQFGGRVDRGSRLWLGNHYATEHPDAVAVSDRVHGEWDALESATARWIDAFAGLDPVEAEHSLAQASFFRSPTVFRAADGAVYGFEGVQGASTGSWADHGGSCPLNCTHVWNYEQALARLFPRLELSMRDTEFDVMQAPDGSIPHRVVVPTSLRQPWGGHIGGPADPALDGMLGTMLKSLREVQLGAGVGWLKRRWPAIRRLHSHIRATWETPDGTLAGPQPSTFDIPLHGLNPYIGSLWLAALRALERMAHLVGETAFAGEVRETFQRATVCYDEAMFDGEYFVQVLAPDDPREGSWGRGCLSDQLVGQWWAHLLGLGHVLPRDHVASALNAVVTRNFRTSFRDQQLSGRVFADEDDAGLLNCTWPRGDRPEHPVWYSDEVWTGVEFQVAASLRFEGLHDEAALLQNALYRRHDGRRRNPFNHIECGDHYVRGMAGFSLLEAASGVRSDATSGGMGSPLRATTPGRWPWFSGMDWGVATVGVGGAVTLESRRSERRPLETEPSG